MTRRAFNAFRTLVRITKPRVKSEAFDKVLLLDILKRYLKEHGSELVVDSNFNREKASSNAVKTICRAFSIIPNSATMENSIKKN